MWLQLCKSEMLLNQELKKSLTTSNNVLLENND